MDINKYRLGILCKNLHDHENTGQSLRFLSNNGCYLCSKERSLKFLKNKNDKKKEVKQKTLETYILEAEKTFDYDRNIHILGKPCKKENHTLPGFDLTLRYKIAGKTKNLCVVCATERQKKYRQSNVERLSVRRREDYKKPQKLESRQAYLPVYRERACVIAATRRSTKLNACPQWLDKSKLEVFYEHAALMTKVTGIKHNVDHIEPLINDLVCGLHVPANLRVTTQLVNFSKNNRFTPFVLSDCQDT